MKTRKIYIAGKISGECEKTIQMKQCYEKFHNYGISLTKDFYESFGCSNSFVYNQDKSIAFTHGLIINKSLIPNGTWKDYMVNGISILLLCDEVHMLPDWQNSKGASLERDIALRLGIKVVYA